MDVAEEAVEESREVNAAGLQGQEVDCWWLVDDEEYRYYPDVEPASAIECARCGELCDPFLQWERHDCRSAP